MCIANLSKGLESDAISISYEAVMLLNTAELKWTA